jgi:hypothetical protein
MVLAPSIEVELNTSNKYVAGASSYSPSNLPSMADTGVQLATRLCNDNFSSIT